MKVAMSGETVTDQVSAAAAAAGRAKSVKFSLQRADKGQLANETPQPGELDELISKRRFKVARVKSTPLYLLYSI